MKNPLSTPTTRLNQILLQAAIRAERVNSDKLFEQRARENAQRLDKEEAE
ncbi:MULTISPECIES: hypothetical protein [unclassified Bradyrhizobium]|nr:MULTISPECIES: hypothetical protein [unclassified Bradyrhizobium]WGR74321.1 hypothetical protein MTX24_16485 [Bradyrhizobium sp. ISRA426]WGR79156.1 hypothetical protein MTX21_01600 [Bradyrhizobium sp. ISRA430]WGR90643.1 hypothetical protein MTX25_39745 [Bradyrhizobium sp. ISRA432]